jgi:hypothetical protein
MKQLVGIIKDQIQQLKVVPLSEWLLSHLKEDASNLTELFAKQSPVYSEQVLAEQLTDYHKAWPLIGALKKQGASDLIQILESTEDQALRAFARVTKGVDLSSLVDTFLVKNANDLELVDRSPLIQFLRQPNLAVWLTEYLESLVSHSVNVMSLKLLFLTFTPCSNEQDRLVVLRNCLSEYPFSIHLETMRAIIYFYSHKVQIDPRDPLNSTVLFLLHDLMTRLDLSAQCELVQGINQECLLLVIELCLRGCISEDIKVQQVCYALLYVCCSEVVVTNKETLALIKTRLGALDSYLFETPQLFELALESLVDEKDTAEQNFSGLWIQRLLTLPHFVAASTTKVLKQLSDRYRLIATTLNLTEQSHLILTFKEYIPHWNEVQLSIDQLNQHRINDPEARIDWLRRRNHLVDFISCSLVSALLLQLEDLCQPQQYKDLRTAKQALDILYSYYSQISPGLRNDLLFRAVDFAYSHMRDEITDLEPGQSSELLGWSQRYLPHDPLVRTKVLRNKELFLYDSMGQKIAFLNESNQAMAFVGKEFVLLGSTGLLSTNEPLYDEQRDVVGYLTESGQVRSADLLQKNRCAHLLASVPIKDLKQSQYGLELLVQNVLLEGSLVEFYKGDYTVSESEKRLWLEWLFSNAIRVAEQCIDPITCTFFAEHHSEEAVFSLLGSIKYRANACSLFNSILNLDEKRGLLFRGLFEADFHKFLDQHDAVTCLAEYWVNYHDKPWFTSGLVCFASYGKKQKKEDLLSEALAELAKKANQDGKLRDKVLQSLISTEESARVVVNEFINASVQVIEQDQKNTQIIKIAPYFHKEHLLPALEALNKIPNWEQSSLYKLVLHIFAVQHASLFPSTELSLPANQSWQSDELHILAEFITRHLSKKRSFDADFTLGYRVLGELIFRSAKNGQVSLFYDKKGFNPAIARLSFTRPFLERLVDKFWIPEGVKEYFVNTVSRMRAWFDEQNPLQKELDGHKVLRDWRHLIQQTWGEINKKKLPIICAYLLSYSGPKKPLLFLLRDYFNTFTREPDYLHPVVKLLDQFPQRDVSAVVFDALEPIIIKTPGVLDKTILHYMAHYYAAKIANKEPHSPQAEVNLLIYFGQNKHYSLVRKGCDVLAKECDDKILKRQLEKGASEAQVEKGLSSSIGRFYFGLLKTITRWWHYGINPVKNLSGIIKLCDVPSTNLSRKRAVEQVNTPVAAGKITNAYLAFSEKRKQLISLLTTIKQSQLPDSLSVKLSQSPQTLFHAGLQAKSDIQETAVAAEQAVVNI